MLELPESLTIAGQLNEAVRGKKIRSVAVNTSAHKFAFYHGDPAGYEPLLTGQTIGESCGIGAMIEISAGDRRLVFGDGANLRFYEDFSKAPQKHQLLIGFEDGTALVCTVQMYGAVLAFIDGEYENKYYQTAKSKPQPVTEAFDEKYFESFRTEDSDKLSAKTFLATEQRIPGLGNGVLQDILFKSHINPKRKIGTLSNTEFTLLFHSVKNTLCEMIKLGGRDTEKDLFGSPGGYSTLLSKNTVSKPCSVCTQPIQKVPYMGGAIYWCPICQPLSN